MENYLDLLLGVSPTAQQLAVLLTVAPPIYLYQREIFKKTWIDEGQDNLNLQLKGKSSDKVIILSGVFEGRTTGTPISILINNEDKKSRDYESIKNKFRPGHADFTYFKKYGIRDFRGGGRQSARETACRVAAGAVAKNCFVENYWKKIFNYWCCNAIRFNVV